LELLKLKKSLNNYFITHFWFIRKLLICFSNFILNFWKILWINSLFYFGNSKKKEQINHFVKEIFPLFFSGKHENSIFLIFTIAELFFYNKRTCLSIARPDKL